MPSPSAPSAVDQSLTDRIERLESLLESHLATPRDEILCSDQLARRLSVRTAAVLIWAKRGLIPCIRLNDKTIRFDWMAVLAALRGRQSSSAKSEPTPTPHSADKE
jgi:hypothetical protein